MSAALQVATALAAIAALLGVMAAVRWQAARAGWSAEVQRKIVHIVTGLFALSLPWLFAEDWPVYLLLALTLAVMAVLRLPRVRRTGIGATLHTVERQSYGDFFLALAIGLVFLFSRGQAVLYVLPLAIVTLADAAAALAGSFYGRRFFEVEAGRKSLEGSAAFLFVATLLAMACLLLLTDVPRGNIIALALMIAGFATLVEADSWRGFDNLFLPLGVLFFLSENISTGPVALAAQMALFLAALVAFRISAPTLGLSRHAARVFVIAVFLLLSVTAVQNAVLPVAMLAAQVWARIANPSSERFPDLDMVAVLALISFGYLSLDEAVGPNALSFFAISAGAMAAGLVALAIAPKPPVVAWPLRVLALATLFVLWFLLTSLNPAATHWHGSIWPAALAMLAIAVAVPSFRPRAFASERTVKLAAICLPPPLALYGLLTLSGVMP